MKNGVIVAAAGAVALLIGGTAGCSSGPAPMKPKRGALPSGTAQVSLDGSKAGTTGAVHCAVVESLTTIETGNDAAGATVIVSSKGKLAVELVRIRNLNGFTGDYNHGLEGNAAVALTDATYHITGTVLGYSPISIEPTPALFTIEAAC